MTGKDILDFDDRQYETIEIPEWGRSIRVGTMGVLDRVRVESSAAKLDTPEGNAAFQATVVQLTAYNGDGQLLFAPEDIPALQQKSATAIAKLFGAALRVNKMRAEDAEEMQRNFTGSR